MLGRGLSVALAGALAFWPVAPPQHVHETESPDGHHELLVHSHSSPHLSHFDVAEHDHHAEVEDEDSVVLTLDFVFAVPEPYALPVPSLPSVGIVDEATPVHHRFLSDDFVGPLIHGPPHAPPVLRGPPILSLL